MELKSIFLEI